jgi:hypothetical protein
MTIGPESRRAAPLTANAGRGTLQGMSDRPRHRSNVTALPGARTPLASPDDDAPEEGGDLVCGSSAYSLDGMLACLDGYAELWRETMPLASRVAFDVGIAQVRVAVEGLDDVRRRLSGAP